MSHSLGRFLVVDQGIVPACFNAVINGAIAWQLNRGLDGLPLWGTKSVGVDFLATAFLLALITCLIVSPLVARRVRSGKLVALDCARSGRAWLPSRSNMLRGGLASLIAVVATLPVLLLWSWLGPAGVSIGEFVAAKTIFTGVLGGGITALIAWWALVDASRFRIALKESEGAAS